MSFVSNRRLQLDGVSSVHDISPQTSTPPEPFPVYERTPLNTAKRYLEKERKNFCNVVRTQRNSFSVFFFFFSHFLSFCIADVALAHSGNETRSKICI